jgi:hypothetical protein
MGTYLSTFNHSTPRISHKEHSAKITQQRSRNQIELELVVDLELDFAPCRAGTVRSGIMDPILLVVVIVIVVDSPVFRRFFDDDHHDDGHDEG